MKLIFDFELIKEIIVLLEVFDLDRQPVKTSSAILKIVVEDENDNTPFCFQNPIQFNLDTSVQNNTILFKIRANDADSSLNGLINYKLLNQSNNFKINETTGELVFLSSEKSIDYGITNLLVELIDNGIPTKTNTCLINIKVFSPNLHQPEIIIENNQTVFYIPEDKSIGSKIVSFEIKDLDDMCCSQIKLIQNVSTNTFILQNDSIVILNKNLDREVIKNYEIILSVTDIGVYPSGSRTIEKTLNFIIDDVNDNIPQLESEEFSITISENIPVNTLIHTFIEFDNDIGVNKELKTFYLIPQAVPFYLEYKINESKLNLFVGGEMDFESIKQYNFQIFLSDNGMPSLNSTKNF